MIDRNDVRRGQTAYDSEGTRLGRVIQCDQSGFFIEKGLVFTEDYRVDYDEVASAATGQVRLRFAASALVPEAESDTWDPAPDPVGTASGTDLEPLRAGMAEIDEQQHCVRAVGAESEEQPPRRGARAWRDALAREVRAVQEAVASHRARPSTPRSAWAPIETDEELERHIKEEVEDFERGAACGRRIDILLERAAEERARLRASQGPARTHGRARARGAAARRPEAAPPATTLSPALRLDYGKFAQEGLEAMRTLERYVRGCGLERPLLDLVGRCASQLDGCALATQSQDGRGGGEADERLSALSRWKDSPLFSPRERAALAWTEAVTRLGADHVDDRTYALARERFGEEELVNLTLAVIAVNGWNRLATAFSARPGTDPPGAT